MQYNIPLPTPEHGERIPSVDGLNATAKTNASGVNSHLPPIKQPGMIMIGVTTRERQALADEGFDDFAEKVASDALAQVRQTKLF